MAVGVTRDDSSLTRGSLDEHRLLGVCSLRLHRGCVAANFLTLCFELKRLDAPLVRRVFSVFGVSCQRDFSADVRQQGGNFKVQKHNSPTVSQITRVTQSSGKAAAGDLTEDLI